MAYTNPDSAAFKTNFVRDFQFSNDNVDQTKVMDIDVQKGLNAATGFINQGLFGSQDAYDTGYLNLAAHFMVMNLRASSQGIAGKYTWLDNSKSAGSVSEGISIPEDILKNPVYSMLAQTNYGAAFLLQVYPTLIGQMFTVCGWTRP